MADSLSYTTPARAFFMIPPEDMEELMTSAEEGAQREADAGGRSATSPTMAAIEELRGMLPDYPEFKGDKDAEIIWLLSQVGRLQGLLNFHTERLRLRQDSWEAHLELTAAHAEQNLRLLAENEALRRKNGELMAATAKGKGAEILRQAAEDAVRELNRPLTLAEHNKFPNGKFSK